MKKLAPSLRTKLRSGRMPVVCLAALSLIAVCALERERDDPPTDGAPHAPRDEDLDTAHDSQREARRRARQRLATTFEATSVMPSVVVVDGALAEPLGFSESLEIVPFVQPPGFARHVQYRELEEMIGELNGLRVREVCDTVVVAARLREDGWLLSGKCRHPDRTILVAWGDREFCVSVSEFRDAICHEIAHLLLRADPHRLDEASWPRPDPGLAVPARRAAAEEGRAEPVDRWRPVWHERGYLNENAASSWSEDVAEICSALLCGSRRFERVRDGYPIIRAKAERASAFLRAWGWAPSSR